jgi:hypothetical protein
MMLLQCVKKFITILFFNLVITFNWSNPFFNSFHLMLTFEAFSKLFDGPIILFMRVSKFKICVTKSRHFFIGASRSRAIVAASGPSGAETPPHPYRQR